MFARALWVACLSTVLLVRTAHCLYVEATLCERACAAASADPPLSDPCESDPNESGCICRGAIFIAPCEVPTLERQGDLLPPLDHCPIAVPGNPCAQREPARASLFPPPQLSARAVRAWFACWQI